ncbi:MAG: MOSC domain-containing protein [Chloroflexi bacterium]|nr:MOSC domain-containing protein [Chloroflexota bacterium]
MKVISVNVGKPQEIAWEGKTVTTAIFKQPITGPIALHWHNLDGDGQADLKVHGGKDKAIYAFPSEHYRFWRSEFPEMDLPWSMFGENLTTEGLLEDEIMIGDQFRIGTAKVIVRQPRLPCYKLGIKFGREDIVKRFLESGNTGIYFAVLEEGEVAAGAPIIPLERAENSMKLTEITRLFRDKSNVQALQRAAELPYLADALRKHFRKKLVALAR